MTKHEIEILNVMRSRGKTAMDIALALQISVNTVRSYIRRHPPEDAVRVECRQCGKPILQVKGRKAKYFCSDKCRNAWWNAHPEKVQRKAYPLDAWYVLGYGTVHDVASTTLRNGNFGQVVLDLQEKLILLGYLDAQYNTGKFATLTGDAIMRFQAAENISQTGIAGPLTQQRLEERVKEYYQTHTEEWVVEE